MEKLDDAVIGAGIAGISAACHLAEAGRHVALIDPAPPMSLTSAASGENYRNWWPHPVMTRFTDDSISLMEAMARETGNRIAMTRRGYALATRAADPAGLIDELCRGYGPAADRLVRHHGPGAAGTYRPAAGDWPDAPDGVDVITDPELIAAAFPGFDPAVRTVVHIRRAGDIDGDALGRVMLERFREARGRRLTAAVAGIDQTGEGFVLALDDGTRLLAATVVNAAGPFLREIAALHGEALPVETVLQQKIAFEDIAGAIARDMPFAVDLDGQEIDWSDDERSALAADPATARLTAPMTGGIHCRPDGGPTGRWIRLGWAYNATPSPPTRNPVLDDSFPEIVLRGAARLHPALKTYYGRLPRNRVHYGGYYTMTAENWPLIGPTRTPGAFVVGALSGFGTMAAAQAGRLTAAWITGEVMPDYAAALAPARHDDCALMTDLRAAASRGIL